MTGGSGCGIYGVSSGNAGLACGTGLNAPRAHAIDVKLDDGMPSKGKIFQEWRSNAATSAGTPYPGCVNLVSGIYYYNAGDESYDTQGNGVMYGCPLSMYGLY